MRDLCVGQTKTATDLHLCDGPKCPTLQSSQTTVPSLPSHPSSTLLSGGQVRQKREDGWSLIEHDLLVIRLSLHSRQGRGLHPAAVDAFLENFDDDGPGSPGVAYLARTAQRLVQLEQRLDDGRHSENGHISCPALLYHPYQQLFVQINQVISTPACLIGLPVENDYLLEVLLRVLLPTQPPQQSQQHFLALYRDAWVVGHRLMVVIVLNLVLFVLAAPITDPRHEFPNRFHHDSIQGVDVEQFTQFGLPYLVQLQKHPHEVSIGLRELLDLDEQEFVVEFASLPIFASLWSFRKEESVEFGLRGARKGRWVFLADVLPLHLFVDAVKEVFVWGTDHGSTAEEHLFECIGELAVELDQVTDLCLVLLAQPLEEDCLWGDYTHVLDTRVLVDIIYVILATLGKRGQLGDALLLVRVAVYEERQEIHLLAILFLHPHLCLLYFLCLLSFFLLFGWPRCLLMFLLDDGLIYGCHVELRFFFIGLFEAFLPRQNIHEARRQFFLDFSCTHIVKVPLVAHPSFRAVQSMDLQALSYLPQLVLQIHGLEVAVAEDQLVELLLIDRPHLLKPSPEVLLEHLEYVLAPTVTLLGLEPLQQLVQHLLQIVDADGGRGGRVFILSDLREEQFGCADCLDGLIEHAVDVLNLDLLPFPHGLVLELGRCLCPHYLNCNHKHRSALLLRVGHRQGISFWVDPGHDVGVCVEGHPDHEEDTGEADDPALQGGDLPAAGSIVVVDEGEVVVLAKFIEDLSHRGARLHHHVPHPIAPL